MGVPRSLSLSKDVQGCYGHNPNKAQRLDDSAPVVGDREKSGNKPELASSRDRSQLGMNAKFDQDGAYVVANGRLGESEATGDLPRRVAVGDEPEHLVLPRGEPNPSGLLKHRDRSRRLEHV
jgi:hypothetical protein